MIGMGRIHEMLLFITKNEKCHYFGQTGKIVQMKYRGKIYELCYNVKYLWYKNYERLHKMADSNITKQALARALKELMQEKSFEKISISDICTRCDMNRKSFYYHFIDKYDLVNWIFDTEFITMIQSVMHEDSWTVIYSICNLLYDNRVFYKKALQIQGQNSFQEHFQEMMSFVVSNRIEDLSGIDKDSVFQINFFTDAIVATFKRWLLKNAEMAPDDVAKEMKKCFELIIIKYKNKDL